MVYNILADYCSAEKITPIQYNYNKLLESKNRQEILMYNIGNDNLLYYGIYNIDRKYIIDYTKIKLLNIKINDFKLVILNKCLDIFIIGKVENDIKYFYLKDFRNNLVCSQYLFSDNIFNNYDIINNEMFVCIKSKKKLVIISRNKRKEKNLIDNLNDYNFPGTNENINNINNIMNMNNNMMINNNMNMNNNMMMNNNYNNNININNNMMINNNFIMNIILI